MLQNLGKTLGPGSQARGARADRRCPARDGFTLPTVAFLGFLALLGVGYFQYTAMASYRNLRHTERRVRAQYIAESAATAAAAAIFQNDFKGRWYRQHPGRYGGFCGKWTGHYGEGTFEVVAEDVVKARVNEGDEKSVKEATYNRIDLFSKGTCGEYSVVLYQALVLISEERVYEGVSSDDSVRYVVR
ncbi:MAG: hypothetical protein HY814_02890 [Candidatus Riflebacteria bacterium]|nr:hypothetical protein [Candidatus Riflebacteria bacterium]